MDIAREIASTIRRGFDKHYRLFREVSAGAKDRFERGDWAAAQAANVERIQMYDVRVREAVAEVEARFGDAGADERRWPLVKQAYIAELYEHLQPELAETFYNSVACRVLHRRYYGNQHLFFRPAVSTEHLQGTSPAWRSYVVGERGVGAAFRDALIGFGLSVRFQDLDRDAARIERAYLERFHERESPAQAPVAKLDVLASLFFRNQTAYVVGRVHVGFRDQPLVLALRRDGDGLVFVDAMLSTATDIGRVFDLARSYFMVDMEVPSAFVGFLASLMPSKPRSELYTMLGLQKQGKTLFYRDLFQHLAHSTDPFVFAPGVKGMVMIVFTLPSFPYVFKLVRDVIPASKDTDRGKVREKYQLVKNHDRVGRMADSLEYSQVALPLSRFDPAVVEELQRDAPSMVEIDGDQLVLQHLYIERRMRPLDLAIEGADDDTLRDALDDYAAALEELASANIFAGDLLLKNFGITRYGRVVFYDYDEIGYLTDFRFRSLPKSQDYDDELRAEPAFHVDPNDVFPEQFPTFLFARPRARQLFVERHAALLDPAHWRSIQERVRRGMPEEPRPYPTELCFDARFAAPGERGSEQAHS